jgi:hypothetical protein
MAKKRAPKSKGKHSVAKQFPSQGVPMDPNDHPANQMPTPAAGMFDGQQMNPGTPMLQGQGQ